LLKHVDKKEKPLAGKTNKKRQILVLGSSHGREIGPMLQEHLGTDYEVTSIFNPNAPLANVVEDLGKLGKNLTKQDHVVIVEGPGNSLGRNYHYSIEKDINFIAERISNTDVWFVGLYRRHDKPWMDRKVRSMNLHLEWALMGRGASHIGFIDTNCIVREEYTTRGLHLNSRGKRKLTLLMARSLGGDHVSGISSIPVITHARASPFLG
jgi:hypothetical protein